MKLNPLQQAKPFSVTAVEFSNFSQWVWESKMQKLGWLIKHRWSIARGTILVAGIVGIIALLYQFSWTGFGPDSTKSTKRDAADQIIETIEVEQSGKTLWDWLSVLGVPLSLAILGFWFQRREQKRSNQQAELEKEIAAANQREEALQAYLDRLSTLLVDKNLIAVAAKVKQANETEGKQPDAAIDEQRELLDAAVDVIRARTLSILRQFGEDRERKSSVIRFLLEAEVISKLNLKNLSGANLSSTNLSFANLSFANLSSTNLSFANLSGANLSSTNLSFANLSFANLSGATLSNSILLVTDLRNTQNLQTTQLTGENPPLLCNVALPSTLTDVDPNRDCDQMPQVLVKRDGGSLDDATQWVNDFRQKQWD